MYKVEQNISFIYLEKRYYKSVLLVVNGTVPMYFHIHIRTYRTCVYSLSFLSMTYFDRRLGKSFYIIMTFFLHKIQIQRQSKPYTENEISEF